MNFSFPGAYPKQLISLTFNLSCFKNAAYVLVYAFYQDKLLFTHHRQRGWELPGGKCNSNESPDLAAVREVFEETGAELDFIKPIAQYTIVHPKQSQQIKTIYVAHIKRLNPLPPGFETDKIQLIGPPPTAASILANPEFSLLLKDGVYRFSLPVATDEIALFK